MNKKSKIRSLLFGGVFTLLFFGLIYQVYWLQIVKSAEYLELAQDVWEKNQEIPAQKGFIYDRNGEVLAQDAEAYTVAVNPKLINEHGTLYEVIEALAPLLDMNTIEGKKRLEDTMTKTKEDGSYYGQREIRREGWKIDASTMEEIKLVLEEKEIEGVFFLPEEKRTYPANDLASHVLGYVRKDGAASSGIEYYYEELLSGIPGYRSFQSDSKYYEIPDSKVSYTPPENGSSLKLTIDENIQLYVQQAIETAYEQYKPKSITAVAVDPHTMEILGMANLPNYNPNEYWDFESEDQFTNHAVSSQYEPGSTFKIVTLAAAVEEGIFNPNDTYQSGSILVSGSRLTDHNGVGWGLITYLEGLKRSSNVAFVKLGYEQLGKEKLDQYIADFGFGQKTGIELPNEVSGKTNLRWDTEVATATYGQGITVTTIQQIAAISAIANGGKLMKPQIVKEIIDTDTGQVIEKFSPELVSQVVSEETAKEVGLYLEQVISDQSIGTGRLAYMEGYQAAGKTGTANVVVDGEYAKGVWINSFIGYAPVEDPKIALIVVADRPDLGGNYKLGSSVVAPVFKEIMLNSLRYLDVAIQSDEGIGQPEIKVETPSVIDYTVLSAENEFAKNGLSYEVLGSGTHVIKQFPAPGTEVALGQSGYLFTESPDKIPVPDLRNKSLRDVMQFCSLLEMECQVSGQAYVVNQEVKYEGNERVVVLELQTLEQQAQDKLEQDDENEEGSASETPLQEQSPDGN
ncbi:penicillin-binding transpeptidase domain-containing protein [Chengkuizengella axinellae]|uniref:Penicillin-binding transpeptidase domain-containing protein n=1 Tax=Chengkuizengella axinellae TaxID=3064388 RepID=A0ABT9IWI6_9BACL|nr:penicillin-binding transpeptidase domain-containing protein [Chengkuizengella sp. 2205SS18-9]MDP5273150.1 penicillin-binding transpeptidase domain-containing protein [Chengkuizengella sp. 2205SS18-9]